MKDYSRAAIFEHWIAVHPEFVRHVPKLVSRRRGVFRYFFRGVTKTIALSVCEDGQIIVQVIHRGRCFDILSDFDVVPTKARRGWVCGLCEGRQRRAYRSRERLYIEHSLKPIAAWAWQNFASGKMLALERGRGWTRATIADKAPKGARFVLVIKEEKV